MKRACEICIEGPVDLPMSHQPSSLITSDDRRISANLEPQNPLFNALTSNLHYFGKNCIIRARSNMKICQECRCVCVCRTRWKKGSLREWLARCQMSNVKYQKQTRQGKTALDGKRDKCIDKCGSSGAVNSFLPQETNEGGIWIFWVWFFLSFIWPWVGLCI